MSAFDDLTLGELDEIRDTCLGGKNISHPDVDPLTLAGAIMWATNRKDDPGLSWDGFRQKTTMISSTGMTLTTIQTGGLMTYSHCIRMQS